MFWRVFYSLVLRFSITDLNCVDSIASYSEPVTSSSPYSIISCVFFIASSRFFCCNFSIFSSYNPTVVYIKNITGTQKRPKRRKGGKWSLSSGLTLSCYKLASPCRSSFLILIGTFVLFLRWAYLYLLINLVLLHSSASWWCSYVL